jgi:dTDP-4-amino-4,6-dideoxygalactose transaminase
MFVRARPYVNAKILAYSIKAGSEKFETIDKDKTKLFFNSGSAALKWFLLCQKNILNRRLKVGVQAYTCISVNDAVVESGNDIVFLDLSKGSFTTLFDKVSAEHGLDILILTHLFGIPNADYLLISEWCRDRNIILINDLSQTVRATICGKEIEDYDDYYFYSFAFDKPISIGFGGMIKVKENDLFLIDCYENELEFIKNDILGMKIFFLYYILTSPDIYIKEFRYGGPFEYVFLFLPLSMIEKYSFAIYSILSSHINRYLTKCLRIFNRSICKQQIRILKMTNRQLYFLYKMMDRFESERANRRAVAEIFIKRFHNFFLEQKIDGISYGSRFSVITPDSHKFINELEAKNVELGCYNWPTLACGKKNENYFPNSVKISNTIINVPIWSQDIWAETNSPQKS